MLKAFKPSGKNLKRMRKDAGISQEQMAFFLHKDLAKRDRISRIERGLIEPTFSEGFRWFSLCCKGVDKAELDRVVDFLSAVEQGKSS